MSEKKNIIFLDVDGPLIPSRMYVTMDGVFNSEQGCYRCDPVAVNMVNRICALYNAEVVFNSSHNQFGKEVMNHFANVNGFKYLAKELITDFPLGILKRESGVVAYLTKYASQIDKYVVVDDDDKAAKPLVLVKYDEGMTIDTYYDICKTFDPNVRKPLIFP